MRMRVSHFAAAALVLAALGWVAPARLAAQKMCKDREDLGVSINTAKIYPALTPRTYIMVDYGTLLNESTDVFNPASRATYLIERVKDGSIFTPTRVELAVSKSNQQQYIAYLSFDAKSMGLEKDEEIVVGIRDKRKKSTGAFVTEIVCQTGDPIKIPELDTYTVQLEPNVVPEQELTNGTKRTVGHLEFKLDVPSLIANEDVARFYLNTDNVISTDNRDKTSKVEVKLGAERSLLSSWYVPGNVEAKVTGDQVFRNGQFVGSTGVKTIVPWRWTKPLFFNSLFKAPISPEFEFSTQYVRWLKQDAETAKKFPKKDNFRLFSQARWNPIHLLPGKGFSPEKDVTLEILGKVWWFPQLLTDKGTKVHRVEGRLEASLLIPVSRLSFSEIFLKKPDEGTNNRIRIKYTAGSNEASGFKRSTDLTFGIEVMK